MCKAAGRGGVTHHTQGGTDCRSKITGGVKPRVKINPFIPLFIVFSSQFAASAFTLSDSYNCQTPAPDKNWRQSSLSNVRLSVELMQGSVRKLEHMSC